MVVDIEAEVIDQALSSLGRAPSSPKESIHISPKHCASVVERKNGIESLLLEFSLPGHRASAAGDLDVHTLRKIRFDVFGVMRVLIRGDRGRFTQYGL